MDRSILKLLLYLSPFILAAVLGLVAGVISLWEKSGPGRRKQALNQKLRNKDRDEAIKRLDQQNKKDRNVLIQIVKDKKDETYIREQALKRLSYVKNRDVFRDLAQDGFSNAILQLDEEQDQDILVSLAKKGNHTVLEKRLADMDEDLLTREVLYDPDASGSAKEAILEKLEYPASKETIRKMAMQSDSMFAAEAAIKRLPYPEERETMIRIATQHSNEFCRNMAIDKLSYPKDRETLVRIVRQDSGSLCRRKALEKLPYRQERAVISEIALTEKDEHVLWWIDQTLTWPEDEATYVKAVESECPFDVYAVQKLSWLQYPAAWMKRALKRSTEPIQENIIPMLFYDPDSRDYSAWKFHDDETVLKGAIVLARTAPSGEDENVLRFLCENIHRGIHTREGEKGLTQEKIQKRITSAGWSAAALGRVLATRMSPDEIVSNLEAIKSAIEEYNAQAKVYTEAYQAEVERYNTAVKEFNANVFRSSWARPVFDQDRSLEAMEYYLESGIGGFMLEQGNLPLAYLVQILRDNQNRIPRFIKQGVIMGLLDWLIQNRTHPEAAKLLETVVSVRADIIRSDSALTFFEVRAPEDATGEEYAALLADVLHCANPSVQFGDASELLRIAEAEVPGCMEMLRVCPLRIIDPVNQQTQGFYQFRPYAHAMWIRYEPPLKEGKVIERYHEVDDRTKPLSSGLNLRLFRDCYAVIPTIFHEYQHFKGDRNEASVFLKTQLFSIAFYRKYKQANVRVDGVFAQLTSLLGMPPSVDKLGEFNGLIERYYGKQVGEDEAKLRGDAEIMRLNLAIDAANAAETWDPEKKLPRLDDTGDAENRDLIRDIVIRFATVPKSITEEEFRMITNG